MTKATKPPTPFIACSTPTHTTRPLRPSIAPYNLLLKSTSGLRLCYMNISKRQADRKRKGDHNPIGSQFLITTLEDGSLDLSKMGGSHAFCFAERFEYRKLLGRGSFAQTIEAVDLYHPQLRHVAVKIMNAYYNIIGEEEYKKIVELNLKDEDDSCNIVRIITTFSCGNHFCLVFELLTSRTLFVHMPTWNSPRPYHVVDYYPSSAQTAEERRLRESRGIVKIKKLAMQLLVALIFLREHHIIHADIKPDNLLFRLPFSNDDSFKVKLIDFGNAFTLEQANVYYEKYELQSLHYRAPEVLLGIPFDYAIDVWSVGILLCEAWIGRPFVRGDTPQRMLQLLCEYLGPIPEIPFKYGKFYNPAYSKCKHAESLKFDMNLESDILKYRLRRLSETLGTRDFQFLRFLDGLLQFDPRKRMTALDAVRHPFLASLFPFELLERHAINAWQRGIERKSSTPIPVILPGAENGDRNRLKRARS